MARTESHKKIHGIYLIDTNKAKKKFFDGEEVDNDAIIGAIIHGYHNQYEIQDIKDGINTEPFEIAFYMHKEKPSKKLRQFCEDFIKPDSEIITLNPFSISTILFVWSEKNLFAITTGQGYNVVSEYCVNRFGIVGLSIFDRFRITALESNSISGMIHATNTIYSDEMDFVDVDSIDIIYKGITGRLNNKNEVHRLLSLSSDSKKSSLKVEAKNSLKFGSSLDFSGLINLLRILDEHNLAELTDAYNSITPISKKRKESLLTQLKAQTARIIFDSIVNQKTFPFDFFSRATTSFVEAEYYSTTINGKTLIGEVEEISSEKLIHEAYTVYLDGEEITFENFEEFFENAKIIAQKGDAVVTSGKILDHLSGEIELNEKNYYIFYGEYYYLNSTYSDRINRSLRMKLSKDRYINLLSTKWESGFDEDKFNKKASINEDYIHLHKIKPEYIEFADLIKVDNGIIYIIHVKDGFDGDMRVLDRQVELSVMRLIDLKSNNNEEYFRSLYSNAKVSTTGRNITTDFSTCDDFLKALRENDPYFVIAINPPNDNLLDCRSNIAKHCLNALIFRCNNQGITLKIQIINK